MCAEVNDSLKLIANCMYYSTANFVMLGVLVISGTLASIVVRDDGVSYLFHRASVSACDVEGHSGSGLKSGV